MVSRWPFGMTAGVRRLRTMPGAPCRSGGQHLTGLAQTLDVGVHRREAGAARRYMDVRRAEPPPLLDDLAPVVWRAGSCVQARLDPERRRIAAGLAQPAVDLLDRLGEAAGASH